MRWQDLNRRQPRLAAIVHDRLVDPGVLLVVTSPVEPFVLDGDLWLSMLLGSRKAADLLRGAAVVARRGPVPLPGRETVRRGTSATSLGEPEVVHDVLV